MRRGLIKEVTEVFQVVETFHPDPDPDVMYEERERRKSLLKELLRELRQARKAMKVYQSRASSVLGDED